MRKKSRKLRSVISSLVIFALITMMIPVGVFAEEAEAVPVEEVIVAEEVTEEAAPVAVEEEAAVVTEEAAPVAVEEEAAVVAEEAAPVAVEEEAAMALMAVEEAIIDTQAIDKTEYYQGRKYEVVSGDFTYAQALAKETANMHLVTINDTNEQAFIQELLKEKGADGVATEIAATAWIGLTKANNQWNWANKEGVASWTNFFFGADAGDNDVTGVVFAKDPKDVTRNNKWFAKAIATDQKASAYILESNDVVEATGLKLTKDNADLEEPLEIALGDSATLAYELTPAGSKLPKDAKVVWGTNNTDAISVNNGVVKVIGDLKVGDGVFVYVADKDGVKIAKIGDATIGVVKPASGLNGIKITNISGEAIDKLATVAGEVTTLTAVKDPVDFETTVTWDSSDVTVASVVPSSGVVTARKAGTTTITATTKEGKKATCVVTVTGKPTYIKEIAITKDGKKVDPAGDVGVDQKIDKGAQQQYGTLIGPADTTVTDKTVTWTSSHPAIASVDAAGIVKGKEVGVADITATVKTGEVINEVAQIKDYTMTVVVSEAVAPVKPVATAYFNNNEYQLFDKTGLTATQAKTIAEKIANGHLVTIGSEEEQAAVASLVDQGNQEYYWMGGVSEKNTTPIKWNWDTSEPFSYKEDWAAGQPGTEAKNNRMVMGRLTSSWYAFEGDAVGRQNVGYIVEIEDAKKPEAPQVKYDTHVQDIGWLASVKQPDPSGTVGLHKRMEAFKVTLEGAPAGLGLEYRTHIENSGWEDGYTQSPNMSGTEGNSLRMEALQLRLSGAMADQYDVYYQVHAEEFGWMPWAKNGEESGTAGYAYQLEGIRVVVVEKDQAPPTALAPVIKTDKPFAEGPLAH